MMSAPGCLPCLPGCLFSEGKSMQKERAGATAHRM
jgi:hypothetical protein